jgi:uncharacterized membrane protein
MIYDRVQLKEGAKQRLKVDGVPSYKKVTLVFLLLTSLLPSLLECIYDAPTTNITVEISQAYYNLDVDLVNDLVAQYFTSTAGMVAIGCSILMTLFAVVITVGYRFYTMNLARNQAAGYDDLGYGLNFVGKVILVWLLECVYIFLWSCLFVIPGIIAFYRYRLAFYALLDDPSISPSEAIRRSKILTLGRKKDLFVLDLSFLGWMILVGVCGTIGQTIGQWLFGTGITGTIISVLLAFAAYLPLGLWVTAYQQLAEVYFYEFSRGAMNQGQAPGGFQSYDYRGGDDWQNQPPQNGGDNGWNQPPQDGGWNSPNQDNNDPWN